MTHPIPLLLTAALLLLPVHAAEDAWKVVGPCVLNPNASNDSDSFHFRFASVPATDEYDHILRLYFVDGPEVTDSFKNTEEQAEYFGVSTATVMAWGKAARSFTRDFLASPFRVYSKQSIAPGASRKERWYGVVQRINDNKCLHEALAEEGLARVYGKVCDFPNPAYGEQQLLRLQQMEDAARDAKRGIWGGETTSPPPSAGPHSSKGSAAAAAVNLNTASKAELMTLPGVGPKTADAILSARPFRQVEDLLDVRGIGEKTLEKLRGSVSVGR